MLDKCIMEYLLYIIGAILSLITILYYYGTSTYDYWEKRGVPFIKPKYPFLGTSFESSFSIKPIVEMQKKQYNMFKGQRFGGMFNFRKPVLFIMDPDLVESVLIKDFSYFYNRGGVVDTTFEPLSAHLVNLRDAAWKMLRNKLTPVFTSGKLKGMHQQLIDCSDELIKYMSKYTNGEPFEAKPIMSKYSINVISSCAFGLNANSLNEMDSQLEEIGKMVFRPSFKMRLRMALRSQYPWVLKLLGWRSIPLETQQYFIDTVKNTLDYRKKHNIIRLDFLHLMNELKKQDAEEQLKNSNEDKPLIFDDKILAANAFVFFVAGFETTATLLSFALFELAVNQDIQEKLYNQLFTIVEKHKDITYEAIKEIPYLSQIISETLRKYPPAPGIPRETTKPYKIPDSSVVLPAKSVILVPIHSLHHDPEFYPEPDKFIPERFSEENKQQIRKGTYLPFGDGPRICIGSRFAILEAEVALAKIILKYKILLNKKTKVPLTYKKAAVLASPEGGIWLNVEDRK